MTAHTVAYNVAAGATREAEKTLQRSQAMLDAQPQRHTLPRLADVAQSLTRAGVAAAHAELCNAALQQLAQLAYQTDTDGRPANVDLDGRLLVPAPWGKSGYQKWGLRRREADVLRAVLMARQTPQQGRAVPLFTYGEDTRAWYVNVQDYPTEAHAMAYIRQFGITSREYKTWLERAQEAGRRQAQARQNVARR